MKRILRPLFLLVFALLTTLIANLPLEVCSLALLCVSFVVSNNYKENSNEDWRELTIAIGIYACLSIIVEILRYSDSIILALVLSAIAILCGIGASLPDNPND